MNKIILDIHHPMDEENIEELHQQYTEVDVTLEPQQDDSCYQSERIKGSIDSDWHHLEAFLGIFDETRVIRKVTIEYEDVP